jgi:hypothetical protein
MRKLQNNYPTNTLRRGGAALVLLMGLAAVGLTEGQIAWCASSNVIVDVSAGVASSAQLTINPRTINFPDADPDTTPFINAMENPVTVTVYAQTGAKKTVSLTVLALGDLASGSHTIPISNVSWNANGAGFIRGVLSKSAPVPAGSWVGAGSHSGNFSFTLANSWNYPRGDYQATVVYTLTAP